MLGGHSLLRFALLVSGVNRPIVSTPKVTLNGDVCISRNKPIPRPHSSIVDDSRIIHGVDVLVSVVMVSHSSGNISRLPLLLVKLAVGSRMIFWE